MTPVTPHPTWFRLLLVVLSVGGGFTGFCLTLQQMFAVADSSFARLLYGVFLLVHLFILAAGLAYVRSPRRLVMLAIAMLIQVPDVSSPVMEYRLGDGAAAVVGLAVRGAWFRLFVGSEWHFAILQPLPWGIGVNFVPFFAFGGVLYLMVKQRPANDADPADRLFVYGTLAPGQSNAHVLAGIVGTWEPATIVGTRHATAWGEAAGYPGVVLDGADGVVHGSLFTSAELPRHWARIDAFEGRGYQRVPTATTRADGTTVQAYVYALSPLGLPTPAAEGGGPEISENA